MTTTPNPHRAPAAPAVRGGMVDVHATGDSAGDVLGTALCTALGTPVDPDGPADEDPHLDAAAVLIDALDAADSSTEHRAACRLADAGRSPREYARDRLADAADTLDLARREDPTDRLGTVTDAHARFELERDRLTLRRLHRTLSPAGIAMFARHARDMREHYAGLFDPDPHRFGRLAGAYADLAAICAALLAFLRAVFALPDADDDAETTNGPTPDRAAADPPPPAGRLLAAVLIAAPTAPPRVGAATCA